MSSKDEDINIFETENQKDEAPMDVVSRSSTPTEEDSIPKSDGIQSLQQNLSAGNLDPEDDTLQEIYAKLGQFLPSANKRKRESSSLERNIIEAVQEQPVQETQHEYTQKEVKKIIPKFRQGGRRNPKRTNENNDKLYKMEEILEESNSNSPSMSTDSNNSTTLEEEEFKELRVFTDNIEELNFIHNTLHEAGVTLVVNNTSTGTPNKHGLEFKTTVFQQSKTSFGQKKSEKF
eukprot:CAMPEP_0174257796 /NCGR_PEP_ID=MMETSP0439-20130205/6911_1 /TAXON_ID=0 /ORGANISM="Stereomyxa ramosa, Strain Chinc5" /LENGTH=232 /DNA_ID=CAMNT_0015341057 /DNA_START=185 /DNA_END=882 /DNA_ORIENTATION=-